jgi:DNA recombination protein RmuC
MINTTVIVIIILGGAVLLLLLFLLWSLRTTTSKIEELKREQAQDKSLTLMQQQIGHLTQNINQQLQNMSSQFQKTTGDIGGTLGDVKKDLGKMEVITREVLDKAKNISNLENLLRAPKFRGALFGRLAGPDSSSRVFQPPAQVQKRGNGRRNHPHRR